MRTNLTKKEIINSIYMQLGFSKRVAEILLDDLFSIILDELLLKKKLKYQNLVPLFFIIKIKESAEILKH